MPKRVMYVCHHCGGYIYTGEQSKVTSTAAGIHHYHFDHGKDCLEDERRAREVMHEMEREYDEIDYVAHRGEE